MFFETSVVPLIHLCVSTDQLHKGKLVVAHNDFLFSFFVENWI